MEAARGLQLWRAAGAALAAWGGGGRGRRQDVAEEENTVRRPTPMDAFRHFRA